MQAISNVAVIGAGAMGSALAALLADRGLGVTLLDLDRSAAATAIARQQKRGNLSSPGSVARITVGTVESDLSLLACADWIIEAAAEDLAVKQAIFAAVNKNRKRGSIVSSSTSTIRLAQLVDDMAKDDARDYLVTHFFNPPQAMKLLEVVAGPRTRSSALKSISRVASDRLDRTVLHCRDTPGFIANRIGNFWMAVALDEAVSRGIAVEEADAILGKPFGTPGGIFGLLDYVGIELLPVGWGSLQRALPDSDPLQRYAAKPPLFAMMIEAGTIGRKTGAGFRRKADDGRMQVLDIASRQYRDERAVSAETVCGGDADAKAIIRHPGTCGEFARAVWGEVFRYASALIPEIADGPDQIDLAMREGYGWREGPFELIGRIGEIPPTPQKSEHEL